MGKRFKRYVVQATPLFEQFVSLLERLFEEKLEHMQATRGEAPELGEVWVGMVEFSEQIQASDFELSEADSFLRSSVFREITAFRASRSAGCIENARACGLRAGGSDMSVSGLRQLLMLAPQGQRE